MKLFVRLDEFLVAYARLMAGCVVQQRLDLFNYLCVGFVVVVLMCLGIA